MNMSFIMHRYLCILFFILSFSSLFQGSYREDFNRDPNVDPMQQDFFHKKSIDETDKDKATQEIGLSKEPSLTYLQFTTYLRTRILHKYFRSTLEADMPVPTTKDRECCDVTYTGVEVIIIGLGEAIGTGPAAPIIIGGIVVGGIIKIGVDAIRDLKEKRKEKKEKKVNGKNGSDGGSGDKDSEKDPKDPKNKKDEAQAPGKPTADDGFIPKKNWDGGKVKNPNGPGYGWPDRAGNVWVPTGPSGHGGSHWDVQHPDGTYDNIVPGGRIRGQK